MKRSWIVILLVAAFGMILTACASGTAGAQAVDEVPTLVAQTLTAVSIEALQHPSPTPTLTATPAPTATPTPEPTPTWAYNPSGKVVAPILLYHHIAETEVPNRYYVSPAQFEAQMQWLFDHGYTAIPISLLVEALTKGAELPARPVVITFDDGDLDVYTNAFPIMQRFGQVGVFYLVAAWKDAKTVVPVENIQEMVAAGWEIGSHSMTHLDLTKNHSELSREIADSRKLLKDTFQVPVNTFAYPFGMIDPPSASKVIQAGYLAGMGLGVSYTHTLYDLYYLNRLEVRSDYTLEQFIALLPWK